MFQLIHDAFHRPRTRIYRVVSTIVWEMIILSISLFGLELYRGVNDTTPHPTLDIVDQILVGLFAVEVFLRVASYRPPALDVLRHNSVSLLRVNIFGRIRFCLQPLIIIDLLSILGSSAALRGLRAMRLLRLLRLLKNDRIFRYSNPLYSTLKAFHDNALLYSLAFSAVGTATLIGGLSIFLFERGINPNLITLADGIWWALVTLTTVGFGDISPVTWQGRIVGSVLMISGMFTLALFAGIVGSTLLKSVLSIREEQFRMSNLMNHVIICGYELGTRMLLDAIPKEIDIENTRVVIFGDGERPDDIPIEFAWITGDPTKESSLDKVRLSYAAAIIIVGRRSLLPAAADANTILSVFTIRSYMRKTLITLRRERPLYIVAEILDAENVAHARAAGADEVIETTRLGFSMLTHAIVQHGSADIMGKITAAGAHSLYLGSPPPEITLPAPFLEVAERCRREYGILIIGVHRTAIKTDQLNPPDELRVTEEMQLIYLGTEVVLPE